MVNAAISVKIHPELAPCHSLNSSGLWVGSIRDFLGLDSSCALGILRWGDDFVNLAASILPDLAAGDRVTPDDMNEMQAEGLTDSNHKLTSLGAKLAYHLAEYHRQSDRSEACNFVEDMDFGSRSRILDVGCGAGQTLFRLQSFSPAECVGIDCDIESLAWGYRMQSHLGKNPVAYVCATGEAIPFANNRFTHILSRVALNVMHQDRAIKEAARVLEPGGMLSLRVMNVGYYLRLLSKARSVRRVAANVYKLGWGSVAAITGFQVDPQRKWAAHEVFTPLFRMRKLLLNAGCDIVHWKHHESSFGFPVVTIMVAKKRG